jgi:hypothetical protein
MTPYSAHVQHNLEQRDDARKMLHTRDAERLKERRVPCKEAGPPCWDTSPTASTAARSEVPAGVRCVACAGRQGHRGARPEIFPRALTPYYSLVPRRQLFI